MKVTKWMKRLLRQRFSIILLILVQFLFVGWSIYSNTRRWDIASAVLTAISFFVALHVLNSKDKGGYKTSLVFLILLVPLFGGLFYLVFKCSFFSYNIPKRMRKVEETTLDYSVQSDAECRAACAAFPQHACQLRYLNDFVGFPVRGNSDTQYFPLGDDALPAMIEEIQKAERYVFLEYFIIREGKMWDAIVEALQERADAGVDVRVIYDDVGCFAGLGGRKFSEMGYRGIRFVPFNRFVPFISTIQNNRDHRKLLIVDGKTAFTGGINIADEYINVGQKECGHWKDSALMVRGTAAWSFTVMFLQMWNFCAKCQEDTREYFPAEMPSTPQNGFVVPYTDSPMDRENVGEHVYMQIINSARKYVYIATPYLIVDDSMVSALILAAKSGVDVRIVTPAKYDRFIIHFTTRSYYRKLVEAGVRIYEYTPGFIHSKLFVSDDTVATVGTTNMDYRSLYLNFECGAVMYGTKSVTQVKNDMEKTFARCREITAEDCKRRWPIRFVQSVMRLFAPLM